MRSLPLCKPTTRRPRTRCCLPSGLGPVSAPPVRQVPSKAGLFGPWGSSLLHMRWKRGALVVRLVHRPAHLGAGSWTTRPPAFAPFAARGRALLSRVTLLRLTLFLVVRKVMAIDLDFLCVRPEVPSHFYSEPPVPNCIARCIQGIGSPLEAHPTYAVVPGALALWPGVGDCCSCVEFTSAGGVKSRSLALTQAQNSGKHGRSASRAGRGGGGVLPGR